MLFPVLLALIGCGGKVSNAADAELAYMGLDRAVERGLALGLDGYNAASSANIDAQEEAGDAAGTMVITGQVDQGESDNKGLRLEMALTAYADTVGDDGEPELFYETDAPALLEVQLKGVPDADLDGTLVGTFAMDGLLTGLVELDLAMSGVTEDDGEGGIRRVDGSTTVTGTATSDYGTFQVDLVR